MLKEIVMAGALWVMSATGACIAEDSVRSPNGQTVFNRWCAGCHAPLDERKTRLAGTYALAERYKGSRPAALEQRSDLSRAYIKQIVRSGMNIMPATRKTEISDRDLDALAAYLAKD